MRKQACLRRVEEQVSAITTEHAQSWLLQQCLTYSIGVVKKEARLAGGSRLTLLMLCGPVEKVRTTVENQLSRKQRPGLPCLLRSLLVWTVEGGSEEAQNRAYSNELGSILNQRMLARRAQDIVPATFFS